MKKEVLYAVEIENTKGFAIDKQLDRKEFVDIKAFFDEYDIVFNKKLSVFEVKEDKLYNELQSYILGGGEKPKSLRKDFHFFETPKELIGEIKSLLSLDTDYCFTNMRFLEPSAGRGAIADAFNYNFLEQNIQLIELTQENTEILKAKGYKNILNKNFLEATKDEVGEFDYIVMNPPYNNNEYLKHIIKAYELLADNGELVAVIPYTFTSKKSKIIDEFLPLLDNAVCDTLPIYKDMFEKTNISVILLHIRKQNRATNILENPYATRGSKLGLKLVNDYNFIKKISKPKDIEKNIKDYTSGTIEQDYINLPYSQKDTEDAIKYITNYLFEDEIEEKPKKAVKSEIPTIQPQPTTKQATLFDFI